MLESMLYRDLQMMTLVKQNSVSIMKAWKYLQVSTNTYQNDRTVKSNKKISISKK